jgi:peptidylprolyl isomerase
MKLNRKQWTRALAAAAMGVLVFALAACQAATPTATETPTPEGPTATPTVTPLVLEGAVTTDSGLQFLEETAGSGAAPQPGNLITMDYTASLVDGTVLVDTYSEGEPVTTVWGKDWLLPGWEEGMGLMKAGGKARMVLPPELAFGAEGYGSFIPANAQVIIEVELLKVEEAPQPGEVNADQLTTSDTGLQYYDLVVGTGEEAVKSATVATHYTIWVKTETGFDYVDTSLRDDPLEFVVGRGDMVFPGWEEGVTGMKVGGKRYLVIPPDLGMGDQDNGIVPANSTLVMEIELTSVVPPQVATVVDEADYTVTESGLKYYDLVEGTGDPAAAGQTLVVNYTGWLEDGTQFDSSVGGSPYTFSLGAGSVIAGWDEGLVGMKVGGKRQLVIPAALGYGDSGSGIIPGGATLIFEVELVEIQPTE